MGVKPEQIEKARPNPLLADGRLIRFIPLILLLLTVIVVSLIVPYFLTASNLISVLVAASYLALLAIGETAVLVTGGIDLSLPGMMAFGSIMGAMFMRNGGNPALAAVIMVLVPTVLGMLNGYAVAYLKMIPFVVTLAMQAVALGASIWVTNQLSISDLPPSFTNTLMANVAGIPMPVILLLLITVVVQLFMTRSIFGRWLYAVGTNIRAARVSGVKTARVLFFTYVFSGFMAGLAGIVLTARLASAGATVGRDAVVLDIISSATVGGVSIYGGVGTALNALIGAVIITFISNIMNLANVSYYLTLVVKGIVIITVVALDSLRRR